jgi:hypothetical protein
VGGLSDTKRVDSIVGWWNVVEKSTKVNFYYVYRVLAEMRYIYIYIYIDYERKSWKSE